jgi:hypothetical protein
VAHQERGSAIWAVDRASRLVVGNSSSSQIEEISLSNGRDGLRQAVVLPIEPGSAWLPTQLLFDDNGALWICRTQGEDKSAASCFVRSRDGDAYSHVTFPTRMMVLDISDGYVLTRQWDDLEVESVGIYRIAR